METTLAQVAHTVLGIDPESVKLIHGDTALTPYSTGTWGSRSMVMSGGAVAAACEEIGERVKAIAAKLLEGSSVDLSFGNGINFVTRADKKNSLDENAHLSDR